MSFTETTLPAQAGSISFDFDLPHRPEKVWRALTEPALVSEWLLPAIGLRLERGATFDLQAPPQPGWDGKVNCRILDLEPPTRLSYAWVVGELDTVVEFTLTPQASGTRLVVVQSGFKEGQKKNWGGARYGWKLMAAKLVDLLARTA
ncbi:MAG TPA: SRPBCC domain-containing protein [Gemmatimonadales bacterium]